MAKPKPGAVRALLEDIAAGRVRNPDVLSERAQGLLEAFPAPPVPLDPPSPAKPAAKARREVAWPRRQGPAGPAQRGRWSRADLFEFQRLFGTRPLPEIAKRLRRPVATLRALADKHFPVRTVAVAWTEERRERFQLLYGAIDDSVDTVARALGVTEAQVEEECRTRLSERTERPWTREEDAFLKAYAGSRSTHALSVVLSRFSADIEARAALFKLSKDKAFVARLNGAGSTSMPRWTATEIETLRKRYADVPNLELARQLQKSIKSVVSKAHHLGLAKSAARKEQMGRENVALRYPPKASPCPSSESSRASSVSSALSSSSD